MKTLIESILSSTNSGKAAIQHDKLVVEMVTTIYEAYKDLAPRDSEVYYEDGGYFDMYGQDVCVFEVGLEKKVGPADIQNIAKLVKIFKKWGKDFNNNGMAFEFALNNDFSEASLKNDGEYLFTYSHNFTYDRQAVTFCIDEPIYERNKKDFDKIFNK